MTRSTTDRHFLFPSLMLAALAAWGCDPADSDPPALPGHDAPSMPPPKDSTPQEKRTEPEPVPAEKTADELAKEEADKRHAPPAPHDGPWLWVTRSSAAVYAEPVGDKKAKLSYVKRGGKVPILADKIEGKDCPKGWFKVVSGGYICSHVGTTDPNSPGAKNPPRQPNIDEVLPYPYARNSKNGTPLYKSIPTKKQILTYEPYLPAAVKAKEELAKLKEEDRKQMEAAGLAVGGAPGQDEDAEKEIPIWEREENLHEVTLQDLAKESDSILATRMMKGFYIAIDSTFRWDDRTWYKTTKGVVTPAERFWQTKGSEFHGVEIDGEEVRLPLAWVVGVKNNAPTYSIDVDEKKRTPKGSIDRFEMVQLEYNYLAIDKIDYFQMKDGDWIRDAHVRMTTPGKRPPEVGPYERWIDVDISEQTLVVFEGDKPVYATLISSGKESRIKEKDHSTPRGMWRVREKHIASTMDGDGSAAGDLPYSIEDVPYIMYFHKSYATHGAFWHSNYGYQMSHGCVNLAPLDAKWIFFYADPQLPQGMHGNWSTDSNLGSMVVVHD